MSKKRKTNVNTPVRAGLLEDSRIQAMVMDGLGAIEEKDKDCFDKSIRKNFLDSLNLDAALLQEFNRDNRWDYLLGHAASRKIIAVEPHSGKDEEISVVIKKKEQAILQIRDHIRDGVKIDRWLWVSSGTVKFSSMDKAAMQLNQKGIEFVGRVVKPKNLP